MTLYFAYGSNMWDAQMRRRCPDAVKRGGAVLEGYRWIITTRGVASVVACPGSVVEGVLFELSASDEAQLDLDEGVAVGWYEKRYFPVQQGAVELEALVYVDLVTEEGAPRTEYIGRINAALRDAGLSPEYVAGAVRRFIPPEG